MNISFYNIFLNTHIKTDYFDLICVFDSYKVSSDLKKWDHVTHVGELKGAHGDHSLLRSEGTIMDDITILLSVALGKQVFTDRYSLGKLGKNNKDISLLMQEDVEDFIDKSVIGLKQLGPEYLNLFRSTILTYYQITYYLWFDDLKDILLMNCFESLITGIYRIDKSVPDDTDIDFGIAYSYAIEKLDYQSFIDASLGAQINLKGEELQKFKKDRKIPKISAFRDQFRKMRNWLAHGKNGLKPEFPDSPSNNTFTFEYRLDTFVRIMLLDLVYKSEYKRKFDFLYQLILEMNVIPTVTPEFPKLRFRESS